ncbi:MurR/RpiR family transcriptional regulator [Marisediminicola sp. LYQ134]|uniref:MurR/RpiR family transcriptional regulator n=1 Tax=unclassified Marisediminicola TaxID=2618316 RepID=UPI003982EC03
MFIKQIVEAKAHELTPTDRRLLDVLFVHPAEAAFWRAQDLTHPLGLHEASATRLAQRLGFAGYPAFREALRQDYLDNEGPSQRVKGRLDRTDDGDLVSRFVDDETAALASLPTHLDQAALDSTAERILLARTVYLFGQGNASILVDLLARRLQRFGVDVVSLVGSNRDLAEGALTLASDDLVLAFAFRRSPQPLVPLLTLAADVGAPTVLVTDTLLGILPAPTTVLAAPRGPAGEFLSLIVPMTIVNALVLTIARSAPESSLRSLDRLAHLFDHFDV